jgi:hypothetical protein
VSDEKKMVADLFGNLRYASRGKGRPPFERTQENANKVSMLLAMGWSNSRIAGCILDPRTGKPISEPTLKRHFRSELQLRDVARDQLTAKRLMQVVEATDAGNVGAMRLLGQLIEKNDMMLAASQIRKAQDSTGNKRKLGKKEQAQRAAEEIADGATPSDWGDDLNPGTTH